MKVAMDKFKLNIKLNKKILVFLIVLGSIALATGSLFDIMLNDTDKSLVVKYIDEFFNNVGNNSLDTIYALKNGLISKMSYILIVWVIGLSIVGIPITLFLYFGKLFILGFSVSAIINNFGIKGILLSLAYIFPHDIINILTFIILTMYAVKVSSKLFFSVLKKGKIDFKSIMNKYLLILLMSIVLIALTTLYEVFIMPRIIRVTLPILK